MRAFPYLLVHYLLRFVVYEVGGTIFKDSGVVKESTEHTEFVSSKNIDLKVMVFWLKCKFRLSYYIFIQIPDEGVIYDISLSDCPLVPVCICAQD